MAGQEAVGGNEKAGGGRLNFELPLPPESGYKYPYTQQMEGAKNRIFVFSKLFLTYKCRRNAANTTLC